MRISPPVVSSSPAISRRRVDFPHPEGTWPHTRDYYRETFSGLPEADGRKILGENAVTFYGLDRQRLQQVADEIGPDTSIFN